MQLTTRQLPGGRWAKCKLRRCGVASSEAVWKLSRYSQAHLSVTFLALQNAMPPRGVIVYLEVAGAEASTVLRMLWSLRLAGWFTHATGVLIGRTNAPAVDGLTRIGAIERALGDLGIPIIIDFDIGHQPPQMPLVNVALAEIELIEERGRITQHLVP
jgi:muramoyltetrapeptide carboxypeptidase LdcA involved in peptidoglycan recycling